MNTLDVAALKLLAESATPGPWFYYRMTQTTDPEIAAANGSRVAALVEADITKANSAFIAAANPAAVLDLLTDREVMSERIRNAEACLIDLGAGAVHGGPKRRQLYIDLERAGAALAGAVGNLVKGAPLTAGSMLHLDSLFRDWNLKCGRMQQAGHLTEQPRNLDISQVKHDYEHGTSICRETIGKVITLAMHGAEQAAAVTDAARDVLAERQRQVSVKDWTPDHDDAHPSGEIAAFAAVYAMPPAARDWPASETGYGDTFGAALCPADWQPKFGDRRRELVKAGALILAEIERMDRATSTAKGPAQ